MIGFTPNKQKKKQSANNIVDGEIKNNSLCVSVTRDELSDREWHDKEHV